MNDVTRKCPACFKIHTDFSSLPDGDNILCGKCGVKIPPGWFDHANLTPTSSDATTPTLANNTGNSQSVKSDEKPSSLRWLPVAFYIIASLGFLGWIIIALNLESWVAFGYGVGSTIACFAGGRTIELLQNIDDELYRKRMSD